MTSPTSRYAKRGPVVLGRAAVRKVYPQSYCGLSAMWGWTIWSDSTPFGQQRISRTSNALNEAEAWASAARNLPKKRKSK